MTEQQLKEWKEDIKKMAEILPRLVYFHVGQCPMTGINYARWDRCLSMRPIKLNVRLS